MINITKSWLFRNKWCIFAQKHLQAKHNMQILLANAKIMIGKADRKPTSTPLFQTHLFDWKRVCKEVTVIQPLFYVRQKDGRLKSAILYIAIKTGH